jgi:hypothetical protein
MASNRIVIGLRFDAPPAVREVIPVQQHRAETRHQAVGDVSRLFDRVRFLLGLQRAQHRAAGAQHVHGVCCLGKLFQGRF